MNGVAPPRRVPCRRPTRRGGLVVLTVLSMASPAAANIQPPGAASCSGCHAPAGVVGIVPSLTGRPADEIVAAMAAFRRGERPATVMDRIAKGFSDEEIRIIAEWFADERGQAAQSTEP